MKIIDLERVNALCYQLDKVENALSNFDEIMSATDYDRRYGNHTGLRFTTYNKCGIDLILDACHINHKVFVATIDILKEEKLEIIEKLNNLGVQFDTV